MIHTKEIPVKFLFDEKDARDLSVRPYNNVLSIRDDKIITLRLYIINKPIEKIKLPLDFKIEPITLSSYKIEVVIDNQIYPLEIKLSFITYIMIKWAKKEFLIQKRKFKKKLVYIFLTTILMVILTYMCHRIDTKYNPSITPSKEPITKHQISSAVVN